MIERVTAKKFESEMLFNEIKDVYEDFFITINNERKFFTDLKTIRFYSTLINKGELCFKDDNGYLLTYGLSDKAERKYIKILAKNNDSVRRLLTVFLYDYANIDWFIKIKKFDSIIKVLFSLGFKQNFAPRGNELLLVRQKTSLINLIDKEDIRR